MQIQIKKAAIRGSLFLSYEFEQTDVDVKNTIKTSSDAPIHDDLRNAFRALIPHFAFICEQITKKSLVEKAIKDNDSYLTDQETAPDDTFFKFRVIEFNISDKDGDNKVSIKGCKKLETNDEITFSTPSMSLMDADYPFSSELSDSIDLLKEEVLAYMQGKTAPKAQMEMFGDDEFETPLEKSIDDFVESVKDHDVKFETIKENN